MLDIDRFKQFNDRLGHLGGDAVLVATAATLRRSLRDEDYLCRWGGDEFCAMLPRARSEQAQVAVKRILKMFEELDFSIEGRPIRIEISVGMVTDEGTAKSFGSLVRQADKAMYRAKQADQNGYAFALDIHTELVEFRTC